MNPCPCGYLGDREGDCSCSAERVVTYRSKISGPLIDRIDLHVEVGRPPKESLRSDSPRGESSAAVAERVNRARGAQLERAGVCNARLSGAMLDAHCALDEPSLAMLEAAVDRFRLSAVSFELNTRAV